MPVRFTRGIDIEPDIDPLELLHRDLLTRWEREFDNFDVVKPAASSGDRVVYAKLPLYDLKQFTPGNFAAGGRSSPNPIPGLDNYVYSLDSRGRPVHMRFRHTVNKSEWQGIYRYCNDEAVAVEYCLQTGVPSRFDRVTTADGSVASFQRLLVNGGGSHPLGKSRNELVHLVRDDPKMRYLWIEEYTVESGRIDSGRGFTDGYGAPRQGYSLSYSYSDTSKLERIVMHWAAAGSHTVFAARTQTSTTQLAQSLASRIADRVIEELRNANLCSPLVAVELTYRAVQRYVPAVIASTVDDNVRDLTLVVAIDPSRWIQFAQDEFDPEMADLSQRMQGSDHVDIGARMLRRAAALITERLPRELPAVPDFIAFAIDWEFEGDMMPRILKECGAKPEGIKEWKKRGWLTF